VDVPLLALDVHLYKLYNASIQMIRRDDMATQLVIRIEPEIKEKLMKLARTEGKTASDKVREMVAEYVAQSDLSAIVDDLWVRISNKVHKQGITARDIDRTIAQFRRK
jgi:predicted DNA-binding protein